MKIDIMGNNKDKRYVDWEELIGRYYEGETTTEEERLLQEYFMDSRYTAKHNADKAVISYIMMGKQYTQMDKKRKRIAHYRISVASTVTAAVIAGIVYGILPLRNDYIAYVYGTRYTKKEIVEEQLRKTLSVFPVCDHSVEEELSGIFDPLIP